MFLGTVLPRLDERQRRVLVGAAVVVWGSGGKTVVAVASGMSRYTVMKAEREVVEGMEVTDCLRVPGGGDRALIVKQEGLLAVLDELVHPHRRGSPVSLLWWSSRSGARLADDLVGEGFKVSERTVLRLLGLLGVSLLANAKVLEGSRHADRDGQFRCLNALAEGFVEGGEPVISVDTKKSSWSGRARGKDEMLSGPAGRGRRFLIGAV